MFKDLKGNTSKELKESMRSMYAKRKIKKT